MTLTDFYRKVLEKLEVVAAGEPPAPEDLSLISTKYAAVHSLLLTSGLVSWAVNEDVPDQAVTPMVMVMAFDAADEFGDERARYADGAIGVTPPQLSERQLRQIHARDYVSTPAQSEYF